jgi:hypothetical protein
MFIKFIDGILSVVFDIVIAAVPIAVWVGISSLLYLLCRLFRLTPYDYSEYFATGMGYVTGAIGLILTFLAAIPLIPR